MNSNNGRIVTPGVVNVSPTLISTPYAQPQIAFIGGNFLAFGGFSKHEQAALSLAAGMLAGGCGTDGDEYVIARAVGMAAELLAECNAFAAEKLRDQQGGTEHAT